METRERFAAKLDALNRPATALWLGVNKLALVCVVLGACQQDQPPLHDQPIHNHGKEYVAFGLRGGKLVVLDDDDYNSRTEPDDVHHVYARKGVCKGTCPPLAKYPFRGISMEVVGPAATIDALPDPSPM